MGRAIFYREIVDYKVDQANYTANNVLTRSDHNFMDFLGGLFWVIACSISFWNAIKLTVGINGRFITLAFNAKLKQITVQASISTTKNIAQLFLVPKILQCPNTLGEYFVLWRLPKLTIVWTIVQNTYVEVKMTTQIHSWRDASNALHIMFLYLFDICANKYDGSSLLQFNAQFQNDIDMLILKVPICCICKQNVMHGGC